MRIIANIMIAFAIGWLAILAYMALAWPAQAQILNAAPQGPVMVIRECPPPDATTGVQPACEISMRAVPQDVCERVIAAWTASGSLEAAFTDAAEMFPGQSFIFLCRNETARLGFTVP